MVAPVQALDVTGCHEDKNWSRSKTNHWGSKQNNCKLTQSSATTHSHVKLSQTNSREVSALLYFALDQGPFYLLVNILQN